MRHSHGKQAIRDCDLGATSALMLFTVGVAEFVFQTSPENKVILPYTGTSRVNNGAFDYLMLVYKTGWLPVGPWSPLAGDPFDSLFIYM